jgi:hypothetical protein
MALFFVGLVLFLLFSITDGKEETPRCELHKWFYDPTIGGRIRCEVCKYCPSLEE